MNELDRIADIVDKIAFPGYTFLVDTVAGRLYSIRVRYVEPDVMSGVPEEQNGRQWVIPEGQTRGQIVQTCFKAILTSLEHRAREHFLYRGKPVLQPHLDIDGVWASMPAEGRVAEEIFKS